MSNDIIVYLVNLTTGGSQFCYYENWKFSQNGQFPNLIAHITAPGVDVRWEGQSITSEFDNPVLAFTSDIEENAASQPDYTQVGTGKLRVSGNRFAVFNCFKDNGRALYSTPLGTPQSIYYCTSAGFTTTS